MRKKHKKIVHVLEYVVCVFVGALLITAFVIFYFSNMRVELSSSVPSFIHNTGVKQDTRILFVGDMMFDRTVRKATEEKGFGHTLSCVNQFLSGFDGVFANLEGPITAEPSVSINALPGEDGNTVFTFPTTTAKLLKDSNITAVSLANNHIFDFGRDGVKSTKQYLQNAGVSYFGDPLTDEHKVTYLTHGGYKIAIVGYNAFLGVDTVQDISRLIEEARSYVDYVFVFPHWGEEYVSATELQKITARAFIDAGADVVIGAHPHVIQEIEEYKGKKIYYSLGNFVFDQYFSPEVMRGLGVEVNITKEGLQFKEHYFKSMRDRRVCLEDSRE